MDLTRWVSEAMGGSMALAVPVALLAGLVSFFSPCVVPLLPGYLSYMTGVGAADLVAGHRRGRMLLGTGLFVLGLAVVFVATGVAFGTLGGVLLAYQGVITRVLGVVIIVLGLAFAGVIGLGDADLRIQRLPAAGLAAAPVLGVVFAFGWTPCIGPALAVVMNLGLNEGTALRGGMLGFAYAIGLGIPFLIAGVAFSAMNRTIGLLRRHQVTVMRIGGLMMVGVGVLLVTGLWDQLMARLTVWVGGFTTVI